MTSQAFPAIHPDELTRPFWDACANNRLVVQTCRACGSRQYPPMHYCGSCQSGDLTWEASSGKGILHSVSTVYRPQSAAFEVPYIVVIVAMAEGWYMMSNLIGCDPVEAGIGRAVRVEFVEKWPGYVLPLFVLDDVP